VDTVALERNVLAFSGWALAPSGDTSAVTFTVADRVPQRVDYPLPSEDIHKIFWYLPQAKRARFSCTTELTAEELSDPLELKFVARSTLEPLQELQNYYYLPPGQDTLPIPDPPKRQRVIASESESGFRVEGYTTYVKLNKILEREFGRGVSSFSHVLDWGCGCGRVTRYLAREAVSITGADIDAESIAWCRENLRLANFEHIPLHPPTSLAPGSFDLIVGVSVLTHLRERDEEEWLAELRRIAAPAGVLLLSVHGGATVSRASLPLDVIRSWKESGFIDIGANRGLDEILSGSEADYYRDTVHTSRYIRERWSQYFEIVDLIPGYLGNLQDLVVMRNR
jgi:2-polyprenyl-3-methyl-5-hydroxy-6-metoxy-1,4-benzoquinol methylase